MSRQTHDEFEAHPFGKTDAEALTSAAPILYASRRGDATPSLPPGRVFWWCKFPEVKGKDAWALITEPALAALDEHCGVVRVNLPQLDPPAQATKVHLGVSGHQESPPTKALTCDLAPPTTVLPFKVEGQGTVGDGRGPVAISLTRAQVPPTPDEILWVVIRKSTNSLGFNAYQNFMDDIFGSASRARQGGKRQFMVRANGANGPDVGEIQLDSFGIGAVDAYKVLRHATEAFVITRCGVVPPKKMEVDGVEEEARFGHQLGLDFEKLWEKYLIPVRAMDGNFARILPYLYLVRSKLGDLSVSRATLGSLIDEQAGLLQDKLLHPCLLELIWSYWMEEGMLVQSFNSITRRFQNLRSGTNGERDPLGQLELDPLRPVTNHLWGWVQDEQSRLSVLRRAHEYDHQYGFTLHGKALAELRTSDRRSKFLEAFHNLLWKCMQFYRQDDDTTVIADGFPILNALKETHYLLAQGAHNQFGSLPVTARQEMMMQQWILSRPEVREFLGSRVMVPYPEPWMDRVDSVKTLKGWTDTSVVHFRDLATFGEQILLSVRWGAWSTIDQPASAANWARYWRAEIQGYIHAYRAATSVDLTADVTDQRQAETRFLPPSVHLRNRLLSQASSR